MVTCDPSIKDVIRKSEECVWSSNTYNIHPNNRSSMTHTVWTGSWPLRMSSSWWSIPRVSLSLSHNTILVSHSSNIVTPYTGLNALWIFIRKIVPPQAIQDHDSHPLWTSQLHGYICNNAYAYAPMEFRADSRFASSQWETALLCHSSSPPSQWGIASLCNEA